MHKIKVINNFISDEDCKKAIYYIQSGTNTMFKDNLLAEVLNDSKESLSFIKKYSDKALAAHKKEYNLNIPLYTFEGFLTTWNTGAEAPLHNDNHPKAEFVQLTTVVYLNDDYEGGIIYFPEFEFSHKPQKGDAIIFPSFSKDYEYKHGVTKITDGIRYTVALWHTSHEEHADKNLN